MTFKSEFTLFTSLRKLIKFYFRYLNVKCSKKRWVLTRTACLGNDVLAKVGLLEYVRFNFQKMRVDGMVEIAQSNARIGGYSSSTNIKRNDIKEIVSLQIFSKYWQLRAPEFIVFDSFSELTDIEFVAKKTGRKFFAHKSDLLISERLIHNNGLLDLSNSKKLYETLFNEIFKRWRDVKIVFIHFPSKYEKRESLVERQRIIHKSISEIAHIFPNIYSIVIPDLYVNPKLLEDGLPTSFPYHFSETAAEYAANELIKVLGLTKQ